MNIFRALGDYSHVLSFFVLWYQLWKSRSSSGISGKSQILFAIVFTARYLNLAVLYISAYNTIMKVFYLIASYSNVYLVYIKFKNTHDHNHDTFHNEFLVLPAVALALLYNYANDVLEIMWTFSIYLESVAILPQLLLVIKNEKAESFTSRYLFALSSYRIFYLFNWVYRYYDEHHIDVISTFSGITQIVLYLIYFFYVHIYKRCCVRESQARNNQDDTKGSTKEGMLQSDVLVAIHLGLPKSEKPYSIEQNYKLLA